MIIIISLFSYGAVELEQAVGYRLTGCSQSCVKQPVSLTPTLPLISLVVPSGRGRDGWRELRCVNSYPLDTQVGDLACLGEGILAFNE